MLVTRWWGGVAGAGARCGAQSSNWAPCSRRPAAAPTAPRPRLNNTANLAAINTHILSIIWKYTSLSCAMTRQYTQKFLKDSVNNFTVWKECVHSDVPREILPLHQCLSWCRCLRRKHRSTRLLRCPLWWRTQCQPTAWTTTMVRRSRSWCSTASKLTAAHSG